MTYKLNLFYTPTRGSYAGTGGERNISDSWHVITCSLKENYRAKSGKSFARGGSSCCLAGCRSGDFPDGDALFCSPILYCVPRHRTRLCCKLIIEKDYWQYLEFSILRTCGNHHLCIRLRLGRHRWHTCVIWLPGKIWLFHRSGFTDRLAQQRQFQRLVSLAVRDSPQYISRLRDAWKCHGGSGKLHSAFVQPAQRIDLSFHTRAEHSCHHHGQQLLSGWHAGKLPLDVGQHRGRQFEFHHFEYKGSSYPDLYRAKLIHIQWLVLYQCHLRRSTGDTLIFSQLHL